MQAREIEREAADRLPAIFAELLDADAQTDLSVRPSGDRTADLVLTGAGRRWAFEVKSSSSPGVVKTAADHMAAVNWHDALPVLVVPHMTPAGATAAAARGVNWVDLSGNASLRADRLYVRVEGRPRQLTISGRPSSPFAPKSSRISRMLLLRPWKWWTQKELAEATAMDPGQVSRVVHRLEGDDLLVRDRSLLRPRDPDLLLDAWSDDYRLDRHDIVSGHMSGGGIEVARELDRRLDDAGVDHAFTGLAAAWAMEHFVRFRLTSVYVMGDPRVAADAVDLRRHVRGANVQLIGPEDEGVLDGRRTSDGLPRVSAIQIYLDLSHLPERAGDAAAGLRAGGRLWDTDG